jgi:hypothetical protein
VLGTAQVLEPVHTEIRQVRAGRKRIAHQGGGGLRDQDLTAMPDGGQPGGAVDIQAHQAGRGPSGLAGVDAHPDPDLLPARPGMCRQRPLDLQHRGRAGPR